MGEPIVIWVGAVVTLGVFSCLVKDNPLYRFVQHAALGMTVGLGIVLAISLVLWPNWGKLIEDAFSGRGPWTNAFWIFALVPGALWYFQLSKKYFWVSTLVSGLFMGVAAGQAFKNWILLIMPQISASLKPLNPFYGGFSTGNLLDCLSNFIFLIALLTSLLYFFFSVKTESPLVKAPMRFGRAVIMICLGSMFASTVMTRLSYLLNRMLFLKDDWFLQELLPRLPF